MYWLTNVLAVANVRTIQKMQLRGIINNNVKITEKRAVCVALPIS